MFSSRVPIVHFLKFGLIRALRLFNVEEKKNIYLQFRVTYFQKCFRQLEEVISVFKIISSAILLLGCPFSGSFVLILDKILSTGLLIFWNEVKNFRDEDNKRQKQNKTKQNHASLTPLLRYLADGETEGVSHSQKFGRSDTERRLWKLKRIGQL